MAQLKADPKYSAVHELLHIFSVEKLGEYMAFHKVCWAHKATVPPAEAVAKYADLRMTRQPWPLRRS